MQGHGADPSGSGRGADCASKSGGRYMKCCRGFRRVAGQRSRQAALLAQSCR
ncbi:hypothetical protein PDR5_13050 [Pseudomonas sp. DR 5-09]|nr:hypothetical protein PDR5_13050 [Pseudomonas sp. DR 5-09]